MEQLKIGEIKIKQTRIMSDTEYVDPYYVFSSSLNLDLYDDITSNLNWLNIASSNYDFIFCRDQISILTNSSEWSGLTIDDKKIASQLFVVDKQKRDEILTEEEQFIFWRDLVRNSINARYKRWEAARSYISYNLSQPDSSDFGKSTSVLCNDYINYNIKTSLEDGVSGLIDYINGEGEYIETGYPSKTYWTQQDQDKIIDIIENGNY